MKKVAHSIKGINKIVIAGYFDPISEGHLSHIEAAKKLGGVLIAIAGTESQCDNKPSHHGKHFHSWEGKVRLLKKLGVDDVVPNIDLDGTCAETLRKIKPNIFAKGDEFGVEPLPQKEVDVCEEIGCKILYGIGKRLNHSSRYFNE